MSGHARLYAHGNAIYAPCLGSICSTKYHAGKELALPPNLIVEGHTGASKHGH